MQHNNFFATPSQNQALFLELQSSEAQILSSAQEGQVSNTIQLSLNYFDLQTSSNNVQDSLTAQKRLLLKFLRICFVLTMRDRNKTGVLLILNIRDNLLPLINDHAFKIEYLILLANILACYYRSLGKFKRSLYHLDQAKSLLPSIKAKYLFLLTFNDYAVIFIAMGIFQKAIQFLKEALRNLPNDRLSQGKSNLLATICYNNLGICYLASGNKEEYKSAFQHCNDFENENTRKIIEKILKNYEYLHEKTLHRGKNTSSMKKVDNFIDDFAEKADDLKDYIGMSMDLCDNMEFLRLFDLEFYFDYARVEEKNIEKMKISQRNSTRKEKDLMIPFPKLNYDIASLENKGILTWERPESADIDYNGEKVFKQLKSFEKNHDFSQKRYDSEAKLTKNTENMRNSQSHKHFTENNYQKNVIPIVKTSSGNFFDNNNQRNVVPKVKTSSSFFENKSKNGSSKNGSNVFGGIVEKVLEKNEEKLYRNEEKHQRNEEKPYRNEESENKKHEIYNRKEEISKKNEDLYEGKSQNPKSKPLEDEKLEPTKQLKKFHSEKKLKFSQSEKNFQIHKTSMLRENIEKRPQTIPIIEDTNNKALNISTHSQKSEKKPKIETILLIHEEEFQENHDNHEKKASSKPKFNIIPSQSQKNFIRKPMNLMTFENKPKKLLEEKETQIDFTLFKRKKSNKITEKTQGFIGSDYSNKHKTPGLIRESLNDYTPEDIEKIKKFQRFIRKVLKKRRKIHRKQMISKRKLKKIQRVIKSFLSKRLLKHKFEVKNQITYNFGHIYHKILTKYYKIVIFKQMDLIIYNFLIVPGNIPDKKIVLSSDEFPEFNEKSSILVIRKALKDKLTEILSTNFPELNLKASFNKNIDESLSYIKDIDNNMVSVIKNKRAGIVSKRPDIYKILFIQRKIKLWLKIIRRIRKKQKLYHQICQRIDKINKRQYLLIRCFETIDHEKLIIKGKLFAETGNFHMKKLVITQEILSFLKDPFSKQSLWDLISFDETKRTLQLNEELLYNIEKSKEKKPKKKKAFPFLAWIILQNKVRKFLAEKKEEAEIFAKCIGKNPDISRRFKLCSNELFVIKAKRFETPNSEKFSLKINGFIFNKWRLPLKTDLEIPMNSHEIEDLAKQILKTAKIRKLINKDYFIQFDEKVIRNMEEYTPGYGMAFLKYPLLPYEMKKIMNLPGNNMNRQAIMKISKAWCRYKLNSALKSLFTKFRKTEKAFAHSALTEEMQKKIMNLQKSKEVEEEERLENEKNKNNQGKVLIIETLKQFNEEVAFIIKIFENVQLKTLILQCEPQMKDRESKEFHIPLHILNLKEITNYDQFRAVYVRNILQNLAFENNQIVQKFAHNNTIQSPINSKTKKNAVSMKNTMKNNNSPEKKPFQQEIKAVSSIVDSPLKIEQITEELHQINTLNEIFTFFLYRDEYTFIISIKYDEKIGEIHIICKIYLQNKEVDEKIMLLNWFFSYDSSDKRHIRKILEESHDFSKYIIIKEKIGNYRKHQIYDVEINNKSQKLYKLLQERLEKRKVALKIQRVWRKLILQRAYSNIVKSKMKLLTVQIQVIQGKYFKLIYFYNEKTKNILVRCHEIIDKTASPPQSFVFFIEILMKMTLSILAQTLNSSMKLEPKDLNFHLISNNPCLKVQEETPVFSNAKNPENNQASSHLNPEKRPEEKSSDYKNSIYLYSKILFFIKTFKSRRAFLKNRELKTLKKNEALFLKSILLKKESYYIRMNCFYQSEDQKVLLNFVNLNLSKLVNARFSIEYFWKTYPNRVEIYRFLDLIKENLFFSFIYGNITASLLNLDYSLIEISKKIKKREATSSASRKLMQFISGIVLIQRTFRKKKAKEMSDLREESTKIKQELMKIKNGKLNLMKVLKMDQEYYRVHIYQCDNNKFEITARSIAKTKDRKELKTILEMDDNVLMNTGGEDLEHFFARNLQIENDNLKLMISEKYENLKEFKEENENFHEENLKKEVNNHEIEDFDNLKSPELIKYQYRMNSSEFPAKLTEEEENVKNNDFENLKMANKAQIVHQEEIEGNLFNVYYQNSNIKGKPLISNSKQKTIQIDVKIDDLMTYNPNLKLEKDSLKNVAEILAKSIKIDKESFFIDSRNINPDALKMRRLDNSEKMQENDKKSIETRISKSSHFQLGVQKLIKIVNEKRKVILKQTKISDGKQYLIIINCLERPLKKIEVTNLNSQDEFFEDYEVLFELKAAFMNKENVKSFIQIDLTLGEILFLCNLHISSSKEKAHRNNEYHDLAQIMVDKLGLLGNILIFEVRYKLDNTKKIRLNQLIKKFMKIGQKMIFVNVVAIRKSQEFYLNKAKNRNYQLFRSEIQNNKKIIGKIIIINHQDEFIVILKDLNAYDLELSAWDIKTFQIKNALNLKKECYNKFLGISELKRKILEIMRTSINISFMQDAMNKTNLMIYYDEDKALKNLNKEEKKYLNRTYKEGLKITRNEEP